MIEHGTITMYAHSKCRCAPCKAAAREYHKNYRKLRKPTRKSHVSPKSPKRKLVEPEPLEEEKIYMPFSEWSKRRLSR